MGLQAEMPELVLASGSRVRAEMLRAAGLHLTVLPVEVDEAALKREARVAGCDGAAAALALASAKAAAASALQPEALVIGADQMLACEGAWFDKPGDTVGAAEQLRRLRGKSHDLFSAASCWQAGRPRWSGVERARLHMRRFSEAFLRDYLAREGPAVSGSVGAYHIEGPGVLLFSSVRGESSVIRGLPLLPLLGFLRRAGVLRT